LWGGFLLVEKLFARTLQRPVPDAPNLLVERIFELLNRCHSHEQAPAWRPAPRLRYSFCAAFYRPARHCEKSRREKTEHNR
jgi:hypothetical protein